MKNKEYFLDLLCKIGFVLLVNAAGFACMIVAHAIVTLLAPTLSLTNFGFAWCAIGIGAAIYWPLRFRESLDKEEITEILQMSLPMAPALGPISILVCRPI